MLRLEPNANFEGFSNGQLYSAGECLYSQGMRRTANGVMPGWATTSAINSATLTTLTTAIAFFDQANFLTSQMTVFGLDQSGYIYSSLNGFGTWALAYLPGTATSANGLIGGQDGNLYYMTRQYLGKYDGTANYTTGTVTVTSGANTVVGSGTTFVAGDVGKRIQFGSETAWYTVATYTDATHITISTNYAGALGAGATYKIYRGWNDTFQDFTVANVNYRVADRYEDWLVMGCANKISLFNVVDSSFDAAAMTLPAGFVVRSIRSGRTGVLICCNVGNQSVYFLWDAYSLRSISQWTWRTDTIQSVVAYGGDWLIVTNRKIITTNGFSSDDFADPPDYVVDNSAFTTVPGGAQYIGDRLVIANQSNGVGRTRGGIWILNVKNKLWEFSAPDLATYQTNPGAVFFDSLFKLHASWQSTILSKRYIGSITSGGPATSFIISNPIGAGNKRKTFEGVRLDLGLSQVYTGSYPVTFDVAVKVSDTRRTLFTYGQVKTTQAVGNIIVVDGTVAGINNIQVGDEITIMEGVNAGKVVHLVSIANPGTATESWTIDTTLASMTEANTFIAISPFKLLRKHSYSSATALNDELIFECLNKYRGKKFLVKVLFENVTTSIPELRGIDALYDDVGL